MDQTEQRVETGSVVSINIEKETQQNANVPPPDVGYAWVIFTAGALAIFTVFGSFNAFGLFQAYYLNIMFPTTSAQSISWIGTLTTTLALGLGAIYGPLVSVFGLKLVTRVGAVCCVLGLVLASFSNQIWQLTLSQGVLFGFGNSLMLGGSILTTSMWFEKKRHIALGIVTSTGALGALVYTPLASVCLQRFGIHWTFRALALLTGLCMGLACFTFKPRVEVKIPRTVFRLNTLKDPFVIYSCVGSFFMELGYLVPMFYFPVAIYNVSPKSMTQETLAQNVILVFCACTFIGRLVLTRLAQKIGIFTVLIFAQLISAVFIMSMWYATTSYTVYFIFYGVYGLFCATWFVMGPLMYAKYYPVSRVSEINGLQMTASGLGLLVASPVYGWVFDKFGHRETFGQLQVLSSISFVLSGTAFILQRSHVKRNVIKTKKVFI